MTILPSSKYNNLFFCVWACQLNWELSGFGTWAAYDNLPLLGEVLTYNQWLASSIRLIGNLTEK